MVSKIFTNNKTNTTIAVWKLISPSKSNLQNTGSMLCGILIGNHPSSNVTSPSGMATIVDIKGIILLPDEWVAPENIVFINTNDYYTNYGSNFYSLSEWNLMEEAGAIFLPAGGVRSGTNVYIHGPLGVYWTTTCLEDWSSFVMQIDGSGGSVNYFNLVGNYIRRDTGCSVRLVQDYNP